MAARNRSNDSSSDLAIMSQGRKQQTQIQEDSQEPSNVEQSSNDAPGATEKSGRGITKEGKVASDEPAAVLPSLPINPKVKNPNHLSSSINPLNAPTYCVCNQISFGDMLACDNENCQGGQWFHFACVGLDVETNFEGNWYCPTCRQLPH